MDCRFVLIVKVALDAPAGIDEYNDRNCRPPLMRQWSEATAALFPDYSYLWELYRNRMRSNYDELMRTLAEAGRPENVPPWVRILLEEME